MGVFKSYEQLKTQMGPSAKPWRFALAVFAAIVLAGCAGRPLMPTPNVYHGAEEDTVYPDMGPKLKQISDLQFVEFQGKSDTAGHGYFHSSPAASSDLILAIRYDRLPGAEHGRPMQPKGVNFWGIDEDYPKDRTKPQ